MNANNEAIALTSNQFNTNTAPDFGGAVYISASNAQFNVTNCVYTNNIVTLYHGGKIVV